MFRRRSALWRGPVCSVCAVLVTMSTSASAQVQPGFVRVDAHYDAVVERHRQERLRDERLWEARQQDARRQQAIHDDNRQRDQRAYALHHPEQQY